MKWFGLLTIALILGCNSQQPLESKNLNPKPRSAVKYATCFQIEENKDELGLKILDPTTQKVLFSQSFPKSCAKTITCAALSSTQIGMLEELGEIDRVTGIAQKQYVYNATILNSLDVGTVFELGDVTEVAIERLVQTKATWVLYNEFGTGFPRSEQLAQLGIQPIPWLDWREQNPLGRAEWIKAIGVIFGCYEQSCMLFEKIESNYQKIAEQSKNNRLHRTAFSGNLMGDAWYSPAGDSYMALLFEDAGLNYVFDSIPGSGSTAQTLEFMLMKNQRTSLWLNPGASSKKELLNINPKAHLFEAYRQGEVYCYSHNGNRFWELSSLHPDWVLSDMMAINQAINEEPKKLYFYQKLR